VTQPKRPRDVSGLEGRKRIAQLAPLAESVPPKLYGGTERVVAWLVDELVELGHDVTLFASADSRTKGKLHPVWPRALRLGPQCGLCRAAGGNRQARERLRPDPRAHRLVAASAAQPARRAVPDHHAWSAGPPRPDRRGAGVSRRGLRLDIRASARAASGGELGRHDPARAAFAPLPPVFRRGILSRLPRSPRGGERSRGRDPDRAGGREAAAIAAKIPRGETRYFKKNLEPHIDGRAVQLVGEVDDAKKQPLLADAAALLFPIDWPEPFGLVMIEAMACGTPVIAYRSGSVPEVVEDGVTGFIVENEDQAVRAVGDLGRLDRRTVRARFEERFSASRMARETNARTAT
jgi:hypothetical protein